MVCVIAESLSEEEIAGLREMFKSMDTKIRDLIDAVRLADVDNSGTIDYGEFVKVYGTTDYGESVKKTGKMNIKQELNVNFVQHLWGRHVVAIGLAMGTTFRCYRSSYGDDMSSL
uniref:EF-hand domain-containing protein n=1 Tax=Lactuca sativa TaxID=4236 RepID=A0A9R1WRM0_LACSA|nr:hypothetical protein LSAT_V11C100040530 [Lactuca sativa]